jgi:hypothetical protein
MPRKSRGILQQGAYCLWGTKETWDPQRFFSSHKSLFVVSFVEQWAYVYVGIYGYGFVEASMNVLKLFQTRGWTAIIADTLVDTVLMMVSFCVGVLTGIIGLIVASAMQQGSGALAGAFFIGMLIGFVFCSTLFGLISSGVNAVIVLFAESPAEFAANHPQLSQEMLKSWREAYPMEFQY